MTETRQTVIADAQWRKSSYSNASNQCVEVAQVEALVAVRDSKNPDVGYLTFSLAEWETFLTNIKRQHAGR